MDSAGLRGQPGDNEKTVDPRLTTGLGQRSVSLHVDHTDHNPLSTTTAFSFNLQKTGSAIYRLFLTTRHFIYTLDLTNPIWSQHYGAVAYSSWIWISWRQSVYLIYHLKGWSSFWGELPGWR